MKPKKVSLTGIKEKMTRLEMKNIMAGSGFSINCLSCSSDDSCGQVNKGSCSGECYNPNTGHWYRVCRNN